MTTASFGFKDVPAEQKQPLVRGVFDAVAQRYDIMNDAMSLGLHRLWKRTLINALNPRPGQHLLDLAGGTGDISFRAERAAENMRITLCDINANMLGVGRNRALDKNQWKNLTFTCGNAESLPFADRSFDACTIAFGLRNVTHTQKALQEIYRVLKPGGHFLCLEFSPAPQPAIEKLYDLYSFHLVPKMGKVLAGDDAPYQYLVESIRRFPIPQKLMRMMKEAGFSRVKFRSMSAGIVALHEGWRL